MTQNSSIGSPEVLVIERDFEYLVRPCAWRGVLWVVKGFCIAGIEAWIRVEILLYSTAQFCITWFPGTAEVSEIPVS